MPAIAFLNGTLIGPDGEIPRGLLTAVDGRIEYAGPHREELIPPGAERVDAGGLHIAPGFVDIHVHGGAGSDFMDAEAAGLEAIFRYHAGHGATALCPTTCAAPLSEILAAIDAVESYRSAGQRFGRALGVHLEGPYFAATKRGCHLPGQVRPPEEREWRQILERGRIARMTLAPELPGAQPLVEELRRRGICASAGHSEALFPEMQAAADWGVSHVTHLYCVMTDALSNRWRGTANPRHGGILEAVYLDERLSSELIADGLHLTAELLTLAWRIKGSRKMALCTDAMRAAGMPEGEYAFGPRHGTRAEVRNGEARIAGGSGLASSVCPMNEMVRIFRERTGCPLWEAVRMASLTPAGIVGADAELGSLERGKNADVLLLDPAVQVRGVWLGGVRLPAA